MSDTLPDRHAEPGLRSPLLAVMRVWRPHALALLGGLLLSLVAFGLGLALLGVAGLRLAGTGVGLVLASALLLRLLGGGRVVLRYAERMATHDAMFRALADLRLWFFRRLAASAAGGIGFRRSGDLLSRLVGDVEALDGLYLRILLPLATALLTLPVVVIVCGHWAPGLGVGVGVLFAVCCFVLPAIAATVTSGESAALAGRASALRVSVLDLVGALREIRVFGAGDRAANIVFEREAALLRGEDRLARRVSLVAAVNALCQQGAMLLLLLAIAGILFEIVPPVPGTLLLFVLLAAFELSTGLTRAGALFGHVAAAARRVVEVGTEAMPATPAFGAVTPIGHDLRIAGLGFRWRADRPPVFEGLNLDIPAGSRVALLGASGAGKSTLVSLLLRVAEPETGSITFGGVDLRSIALEECRRRFAWLGQDTHLFSDTVRANLLLGRPDASEAELWQVLDQARLAEVVRALPEGLDTWLGEGGTGLSGGQSRRLALARALLSAAPVLVLDEPAAGLDAATEAELLSTLDRIGRDRTIILVVHRLLGVERLDRAWRIADGRASAAAG